MYMHIIKMIAILFVATVLLQLSNQQTVEQLVDGYVKLVEPLKLDCLKESGADSDVIDKEVKLGEFSEDQNSKCFWKCFLKRNDAVNDNDEIQEENLRPLIRVSDKKLADEIHKKCASIRGSDPCDTSDKISKCVYTAAKAALTK